MEVVENDVGCNGFGIRKLQIELKAMICVQGHEMLQISRSPEAEYFQEIAAHRSQHVDFLDRAEMVKTSAAFSNEVLLLSSQRHSSGINLQAQQHLTMIAARKTLFVTIWILHLLGDFTCFFHNHSDRSS